MSSSSRSTRITCLLVIDTVFLVLELAVGIAVGSLALMADAFHMLSDIISLTVGLWAISVAKRSSTDKFSFGYLRAEVLGAFFNAVFLIALCLSIFLEATQRLLDPPKIIEPRLVLFVGILGLASNIGGFFILGGHGHSHGSETSLHAHDADDIRPTDENYNHYPEQAYKNGEARLINYETNLVHHHKSSLIGDEPIESSSMPCNKSSKVASCDRSSCPDKEDNPDFHSEGHKQRNNAATRPQLVQNFNKKPDRNLRGENSEVEVSTPTENDPLITHKSPERRPFTSPNKKERHDSWHEGHTHKKHKVSRKSSHSHTDMGMNAIILHVIGDALGNMGVIISGLIIWLTEWSGRFYTDPAVSIFITLIILRSTIPLTVATAKVLLQATPDHIKVEDIRNDIKALPGVINCHHVHIWQLSDTQIIASLHIHFDSTMSEVSEEKYMTTAKAVRKCLHARGIHSATIQPEFHSHKGCTIDSELGLSNSLDGTVSTPRCEPDRDECQLPCVDECQGKPCCSRNSN